MANTEQQIRKYISAQRKLGKSDPQIIVALTKDKGQMGKAVNEIVKQVRAAGLSPTEELANYFDLTHKANPKAQTVNKKPTLGDKAKSTNYSIMSGAAKSFGGVAQAYNSANDALAKGINAVTGTKLPTNNRKNYDRDVKSMEMRQQQLRNQAGYSGIDLGELGADIVAKAPLYAVGGVAGSGLKGLGGLALREGAAGALDGSLRHANTVGEQAANTALGAVGGAVGGVAGNGVGKAASKGVQVASRRAANKSGATATAATKLVDDAIRDTGITLTPQARANVVANAEKLLSKGRQIDAKAAVRKELLDRHGIKGTKAQISRDPTEWKNERELAKNNDALNNAHIENHEQVANQWQDLADSTGARSVDNNARMESTFDTLKNQDAAAQYDINELYRIARGETGNDLPLNHLRFVDAASRELEAGQLGSFVPSSVKSVMKEMFGAPNAHFSYAKSEELIKILNGEFKKAERSGDGNVVRAIGIIRKNLVDEVDNSVNDLSGALGQGNGSLAGTQNAWQTARSAAKQRFEGIEANPTLKAALDDVVPDNAFDTFVLKSKKRDLVRLVDDLKKTPEGQQNLKDLQGATVEHFLSKATQANNGAFSPAGLNRAIESFGNNRMKALFSPEQIARINDIKQVSDILTQQPLGAHVNHSNTASVLINQLLGIVSMTGKIPMVGNLALGSAKAVGDLAKGGAAIKMLNGQPSITKNSALGLTDEQLQMLGMIPTRSGQVGAAIGANLGD